MPEQIEADHPQSPRGERLCDWGLHPPREQQAMEEDDDVRTLAVLVVDEAVACVSELVSAGGRH